MAKRETRVLTETLRVTRRGQVVGKSLALPANVVRVAQIAVTSRLLPGSIAVKNRYFGVAPAGKTDVTGLTKEMAESVNTTFSVNALAIQKIYFAHPVANGLVSLSYAGFAGGFLAPTVISVTDSETGFTEDYYFWESALPGLGNTVIEVKTIL